MPRSLPTRTELSNVKAAARATAIKDRGYGIGTAAVWGSASLKLTAAWRDAHAATTAPDKRPRLWVQGGWTF